MIMKRQQKNNREGGPNVVFEDHYLVRVLKSLYRESLNLPTNKTVVISSSFYNQSVEEMNEGNGEGDNLLKVFKHLKEQKYIKSFSEEIGMKNIQEEETFDDNGNSLMPRIDDFIYYRKYECELVPEKIINYLRDLSILPKYFINIYLYKSTDTLVLNNKYILSRPNFGGPAENLFSVIYKNTNQKLTKKFIEIEIRKVNKVESLIMRRMDGILADLGFKKEIKKLFFLHTSNEALYFRNQIFLKDVEEEVNLKVLEKQIKELRPYLGPQRNSMK